MVYDRKFIYGCIIMVLSAYEDILVCRHFVYVYGALYEIIANGWVLWKDGSDCFEYYCPCGFVIGGLMNVSFTG